MYTNSNSLNRNRSTQVVFCKILDKELCAVFAMTPHENWDSYVQEKIRKTELI